MSMNRWRQAWVPGLCALILAGCARAPVAEIGQFSNAVATVDAASQPLLDDLAAAERAQGRQIAVRRAQGTSSRGPAECLPPKIAWQAAPNGSGFIRGLCLADAGFFSDLGDPPATATLRRSLAVIVGYARLLDGLANGSSAAQTSGQLAALAQIVAEGLGGGTGPGGGPGGGAGSLLLGPLSALKPILAQALAANDQAQALRLIKSGAPAVTSLIAAERDAIPAMFNTLVEANAAALGHLDPKDPAVASSLQQIEAYRKLLADYAVLLERLGQAWAATVAAADHPAGPASLTAVLARSAELTSLADNLRRALAATHQGLAAAGS